MGRTCLREGCEDERRTVRGSRGLFCSDECLMAHSRDIEAPSGTAGMARDIVRGDGE